MNKGPRMADPLWVRCCELWDQLKPEERSIVVKAMEYMVGGQRMESELTNDESSNGGGNGRSGG